MPSNPSTPHCALLRTRRYVAAAVFLSSFALAPLAVDAPPSARLIASPEPDWPQFRGPRRDGISDERALQQSWPDGGPKLLWSATNLGRGYSSPVIVDGRLFITGDVGEELHLFALDLEGRSLWQAKNGASWRDPYPGARASITCSAGRLYHENAHGRVACFEAKNGKELWSLNLLERFRGQNITWGLSECLLVDERAVYATAGGSDALLVALGKESGEVLWKSEPLLDPVRGGVAENASYVSPILVQFRERRLLVGCSLNHFFCADADSGKIQWTRRNRTTYSLLAMMPTLVGDGIFMTAPHGKSGHLFHLKPPTPSSPLVGFEERWSTRLDTLHGGVVHVDGKLLGSFFFGRKGWAAVNAANGEMLYDAPQFARGAGLYADRRLYALCENGWMLLLEAGAKQFEVKGRFRFADASANDAWAHPVIHQGRLYLRYHETLFCYDIRG